MIHLTHETERTIGTEEDICISYGMKEGLLLLTRICIESQYLTLWNETRHIIGETLDADPYSVKMMTMTLRTLMRDS